LNDELLEDDEKEMSLDEIKEKRENASSEVKRALKLFEENILHYSQNPRNVIGWNFNFIFFNRGIITIDSTIEFKR